MMFAAPNYHIFSYQLAILPLAVPRWRSTSAHHVRHNSTAAGADAISVSFKEVTRHLNLSSGLLKNQTLSPVFSPRRKLSNIWRQSFVSTNSFNDNKVVGISQPLHSNLPSANRILLKCVPTNFAFNQQIRAFKTKRNTVSESLQNPTLSDRLRTILPNEGSPKMPDRSFLESDTSDARLTDKERLRVKLAFAEGYTAGKHSSPKGLRILKAVQNLLILVLMVVVTGKREINSFRYPFR